MQHFLKLYKPSLIPENNAVVAQSGNDAHLLQKLRQSICSTPLKHTRNITRSHSFAVVAQSGTALALSGKIQDFENFGQSPK